MSAILSADDLNDFISPGVACIKPVEALPKQSPSGGEAYEVAKEGQIPEDSPPAQISLTDCLACSGCVTSAEAVLVSLQSHAEVLNALDTQGKVFVASVSPQVRASIAATYQITERRAGYLIEQLLAGPEGLARGGKYGNSFEWVVDTNAAREATLVLGAEETNQLAQANNLGYDIKKPILSSACPGWICYAEKTHPHVLPHISRLKSPQALTGTLLKTVLLRTLNASPDTIWHLAVMPCFDKKLEASREELTDTYWREQSEQTGSNGPIRDVDCVITARELLMLAETRGISFPNLPRRPLTSMKPFPDSLLHPFFFPTAHSSHLNLKHRARRRGNGQPSEAGSSGGYLYHILQTQLALHPDSTLRIDRGRNADVIDYTISSGSQLSTDNSVIFKAARYYGFHNIQNLVRKLKPAKKSRLPGAASLRNHAGNQSTKRSGKTATASSANSSGLEDYAYIEVMACPGGCTNGGGQIRVDDLPHNSHLATKSDSQFEKISQKEWLAKVDEAYFSMTSDSELDDDHSHDFDTLPPQRLDDMENHENNDDDDIRMDMTPSTDDFLNSTNETDTIINGISPAYIHRILAHWSATTQIPLDRLVCTSYREVHSDVGKKIGAGDGDDAPKMAEQALKAASGW